MATIAFKTDDDFKRQLEESAKRARLPVGTFIKLILGNVIDTGQFNVSFAPKYPRLVFREPNKKTQKAIEEVQNGKNTVAFNNAEAMILDLDNADTE